MAKGAGIDLPNFMLKANEALLLGIGGVMMSTLIDSVWAENKTKIELYRQAPPGRLGTTIRQALISQDEAWRTCWESEKRCEVAYQKWSPIGVPDDEFPEEVTELLKADGWEYLSRSVRSVFVKGRTILKIATNVEGALQNSAEANFLMEKGGARGSIESTGRIRLSESSMMTTTFTVAAPELVMFDESFGLWLAETRVYGEHPDEIEPDVKEAIDKFHKIKDLRPDNILMGAGSSVWVIDPGLPEAQSVKENAY